MHKSYGYDELCNIIETCVTDTAYQEVSSCKCILMVALNEEMRLKRCVDSLLENNPEIKIIFISQPAMESVLKDWYGQYPVVGWKGKYNSDIITKLKKEVDLSSVDGFLYFTEQPINTRDMNFMEIAEKMQQIGSIRIYSNTIGEDLYEYHNLALYIQAIKVYEEVNLLIDCYNSAK